MEEKITIKKYKRTGIITDQVNVIAVNDQSDPSTDMSRLLQDTLLPSDLKIQTLYKNVLTFTTEEDKDFYYKIEIPPKSIQDLMNYWMGQEEHQRRETVRSDKDRENQKIVDVIATRYNYLKAVVEQLDKSYTTTVEGSPHDKIGINLIDTYLKEMGKLEEIINNATCKDIKELE